MLWENFQKTRTTVCIRHNHIKRFSYEQENYSYLHNFILLEKYLFQRTYFQVKAIPFSMLRYTVQNLLKRLTNRDKYLLFAWRTRVTSSIDESSGTVNVISIQFQVSIYLEINRKMFFYIGLLYILIFRSCQQPPSNYKFLNFWICIENLYWELREYLCIIFIFNYLQFFLLIN